MFQYQLLWGGVDIKKVVFNIYLCFWAEKMALNSNDKLLNFQISDWFNQYFNANTINELNAGFHFFFLEVEEFCRNY